MEAINDLHTRICCLEKELVEAANILAEKEKMVSLLSFVLITEEVSSTSLTTDTRPPSQSRNCGEENC